MSNKMLIDASHQEETRVVVMRENRIVEFDFESADKKQLRGNIYLARVTRVEPSLQAAFVEYGGNRHGFLAFNEIHPDYYQIPVADRQALLEAEAEAARLESEEEGDSLTESVEKGKKSKRGNGRRRRRGRKSRGVQVMAAEIVGDWLAEELEPEVSEEESNGVEISDADTDQDVESVGEEDALEEVSSQRRASRKNYKIQEVIKRRQILLVQVVKEERGNKGAALTTYLSLAGRYSVLMPNTARGGGISRKITNLADRKRLKEVVKDLEVPQGMGVILRTAGANRTKAEVKRDYDYLMRLWDNVRDLTLKSTAPCIVYEEGSLIKRSIRDLYNKDIGEVLVAGEEGYREAKDFMRMLMPSHAKAVQPHKGTSPIFSLNGIEAQLDGMLQPQVVLPSGGYLIINQTEALVAIDVNSGRSTREHSIEDTALRTNLEAAEEVARQLRLRDLAGLVVIDFIDMEESRNNRAVERKLKDCLKRDRARIQVGRISHFGLLEMSRQRIRASVLDSTMQTCPHCSGTGFVRSDSSWALFVLRSIEEHLQRHNKHHITVRVSVSTALYLLNHKRDAISELEAQFGLRIALTADDSLGHQEMAIDRDDRAKRSTSENKLPGFGTGDTMDFNDGQPEAAQAKSDAEEGKSSRKRRRRGKDKDRDSQAETSIATEVTEVTAADDETAKDKKKKRRGRRGGRRNRNAENNSAISPITGQPIPDAEPLLLDVEDKAPEKAAVTVEPVSTADDTKEPVVEPKPKRRSRRKTSDDQSPSEPLVTTSTSNGEDVVANENKPKRGWWLRRGFFG